MTSKDTIKLGNDIKRYPHIGNNTIVLEDATMCKFIYLRTSMNKVYYYLNNYGASQGWRRSFKMASVVKINYYVLDYFLFASRVLTPPYYIHNDLYLLVI